MKPRSAGHLHVSRLRDTMNAYRLAVAVIALILPSAASLAAPTEDQVRQVVAERAIPNWKRAAAQIADVKSRLPSTPFQETWGMLDDLLKSKSGTAVLTRASNPRDANELLANSSWLRWKILTDKADGRYSYTYSYLLGLMKNPDGDFLREAAVFFYHGRLAISVDGARCVDKSSQNHFIDGYETQPTFQRIRDAIAKMTPNQRATAILEAVAIEEMVGERPPYEWLCVQGVRTMRRALEQGRTREKEEGTGASGLLGGQGNTYSIDTSGIKAELVSDEEWKRLRRKVLDDVFSGAVKSL